MVNRSDNDCRFEETSVEGAAGSSATTTAPGAPGVLESPFVLSSPCSSKSDIVRRANVLPNCCDGYFFTDKSQGPCRNRGSSAVEHERIAHIVLSKRALLLSSKSIRSPLKCSPQTSGVRVATPRAAPLARSNGKVLTTAVLG